MIDGAPQGTDCDHRHELLWEWTQSSRAKRVTMFMTKKQLQELAKQKDYYGRDA